MLLLLLLIVGEYTQSFSYDIIIDVYLKPWLIEVTSKHYNNIINVGHR